jgi:hypothetical protein
MSVLALAAAAAAAAVAVLVRRQYKVAIETDTEGNEGNVDNANAPDVSVPEQPNASGQGNMANGSTMVTDTGTVTDVNEQSSTSGR